MQITLKAARVNANVTRKEAAKAVEVDPQTIYNWESGKTTPGIGKFRALCQLYGVSMTDIKGGF